MTEQRRPHLNSLLQALSLLDLHVLPSIGHAVLETLLESMHVCVHHPELLHPHKELPLMLDVFLSS